MPKKNMLELMRQLAIAHETSMAKAGEVPMPDLSWNQGDWVKLPDYVKPGASVMEEGMCGTAGCIAGNTVLLAGAKLVGVAIDVDPVSGEVIERDKFEVSTYEVEYEGEVWTIKDLAAKLLGLTGNEAIALFSGYNELADIEHIIKRWADNEA